MGSCLSDLGPEVAFAGVTSYRDAVLADAPYAYVPLTETSGTTAADASGNGRAASLNGGVVLGDAGPLVGQANNRSARFGAVGRYAAFSTALVPATGDWTVETWAQSLGEGINDGSTIWSQYYDGYSTRLTGQTCRLTVPRCVGFQIGDTDVYAPGRMVDDAWYHLVFQRSGSTLKVFVNAALVLSATHTGPADTKVTWIGGHDAGGPLNSWFNGRVAHFAVYRSALSAARIEAHYAASDRYLTRDPAELYGSRRSSGYAGDPVNTATGNFTQTDTDLRFAVGGLDVSRTYNSLDGTGALGVGWSWDLGSTVSEEAGTGNVSVVDRDGRRVTFVKSGAVWLRPEEFYATLVKNGDGTFTLHYDNGKVEAFNASGRLATRSDWDGTSVTFTYTLGLLTSAAHSAGLSLEFTYTNGLLAQIDASDGRSVHYGYTAGRLTSFTDPTSAVTVYEYDAGGLLSKVVDPDGVVVIESVYDESGRVASQTTAAGDTITFAYDDDSGVTDVTHARGAAADATTTYAHDRDGRVTSITDAFGNALTKSYDSTGNLTSIVDRRGANVAQTFDGHGNVLTRSGPEGVNESTTRRTDL